MASKRTKIVCTIGPASSSPEILEAMIRSGMNVARLNFSHGSYENHAQLIANVRAAAETVGEPVALLQDLQGPKIRVGDLPDEGVLLEEGKSVTFTTGEADLATMRLPVTYERLHLDVKPGERILLDDGVLSARVIEVRDRDVRCEVVDGGRLLSHKGVNFPESDLRVSSLSEKDREDVRFGVAQHVDFIALSFVRSAAEVEELRALIAEVEAAPDFTRQHVASIKIVAKIEKQEAVEGIEAVLNASDAIMVARGDLGIEMPAEKVPVIQKRLIEACRRASKPVIVATQMLDSMIRNPRPTRAETSDVENAVIDQTDAVMLSGESATGKYPLEAVQAMARAIEEAEASEFDDPEAILRRGAFRYDDDAAAQVAAALSGETRPKAILVGSRLGEMARFVSRFRPGAPIAAATDDPRVERQLAVSRGVRPFVMPRWADTDELFERGMAFFRAQGLAESGDAVMIVAGEPVGDGRYVETRDMP